MYRQNAYVVKTGINAAQMRLALTKMADIGRRLLKNEPIGSADKEGYLPRGLLKNEVVEKPAAIRGIDMLLDKIAGRAFRDRAENTRIRRNPACAAGERYKDRYNCAGVRWRRGTQGKSG